MQSILRWAALAAVASTGCATMAHGTGQAVTVISDPSNAQVFVNGKPVGTTPLEVDLARWRKRSVLRVEKASSGERSPSSARSAAGLGKPGVCQPDGGVGPTLPV